ncbi:MAG: hypothetical protein QM703_22690 [Gemmatales bacterium]
MPLIQIEGEHWINPERVSSVQVREVDREATLVVQMIEGEPIYITKLGGVNLSQAKQKIAQQVNDAIAQERSSKK